MVTLFDQVRSEKNIFEAWRHVKSSAINSGSREIRGFATKFEHEHQKHLKRIIAQLREGRFSFKPVKGVLKDKAERLSKGKQPRPIAIAPIENRIVQRAILQVLQPRKVIDPSNPNSGHSVIFDPRLGRINDVNQSKYGVGGLIFPFGGVEKAVLMIANSIDKGAKYYFKSDIKNFFSLIPVSNVCDFILKETSDKALCELFRSALAVEIENADEIKGFEHLFPSDGIGVAQGSALSAFAGNVLLYELDHTLNSMGVVSMRYIDDILIVSDSKENIEAARKYAESAFTDLSLAFYVPTEGSDKASEGETAQGVEFLGCMIQPKRISPSKKTVENFKRNCMTLLSESKSAVKEFAKKKKTMRNNLNVSHTLETLGKRSHGWLKALEFCTDRTQFVLMDDYLANSVDDYLRCVHRYIKDLTKKEKMVVFGISAMTA